MQPASARRNLASTHPDCAPCVGLSASDPLPEACKASPCRVTTGRGHDQGARWEATELVEAATDADALLNPDASVGLHIRSFEVFHVSVDKKGDGNFEDETRNRV